MIRVQTKPTGLRIADEHPWMRRKKPCVVPSSCSCLINMVLIVDQGDDVFFGTIWYMTIWQSVQLNAIHVTAPLSTLSTSKLYLALATRQSSIVWTIMNLCHLSDGRQIVYFYILLGAKTWSHTLEDHLWSSFSTSVITGMLFIHPLQRSPVLSSSSADSIDQPFHRCEECKMSSTVPVLTPYVAYVSNKNLWASRYQVTVPCCSIFVISDSIQCMLWEQHLLDIQYLIIVTTGQPFNASWIACELQPLKMVVLLSSK